MSDFCPNFHAVYNGVDDRLGHPFQRYENVKYSIFGQLHLLSIFIAFHLSLLFRFVNREPGQLKTSS